MRECNPLQGLYVDDTNKVLMCTHGKAGATTWKTILANNSMKHPILNWYGNIHYELKTFGIKLLGSKHFSERDIQERLQTYFKFMVVRHPFDR